MREPNASVRARAGVAGVLGALLFLMLVPMAGIWAAAPTQGTSTVEPLPPRSPQPATPNKAKKETKGSKDSERPAGSVPQLAKHLDETIKILERDINDTAEVARTSVKIRASQVLQEMQQAQRELARSESEAKRLAKPSAIDLPANMSNSSAVISTLIPADPAIIAQALRRAAQKVNELKQETDSRFVPPVQQAAQAAPGLAEQARSSALTEAHKALVVPLKDVRTAVTKLSGRSEDVPKATLAKIHKQLDLVRSRISSTLYRMADSVSSKALQTLDAAAGNSSQARVAAQHADKVVEAMHRLSEQRTHAALSQLDKMLNVSTDNPVTPLAPKTGAPAQPPAEEIRRHILAASGRATQRLTALREEVQKLQK